MLTLHLQNGQNQHLQDCCGAAVVVLLLWCCCSGRNSLYLSDWFSTSFFSLLRKKGAIFALSSAALAAAICLSRPVAFLSLPAVMRFSYSSLKVLASPSKPWSMALMYNVGGWVRWGVIRQKSTNVELVLLMLYGTTTVNNQLWRPCYAFRFKPECLATQQCHAVQWTADISSTVTC